MQDELAKLDFQAALLLGYRGELALGANSVQGLKKPSLPGGIAYYVRVIQGVGEHADSPALDWVFKALPMGLLDMNGANLVDLEFNYMLKPLRDGGFRACLDQGPVLEELLKNMSPYRFDKLFARITAPAVNSTVMRTTYVACVTRQAQIACALERWFIDHHEYPDSLEALAAAGGAPLPIDPLSGKPLSYRKTSDGKYALWCDGFDGKNDGGVRKLKADHPEKTKFSDESYKGDWVWSYQP